MMYNNVNPRWSKRGVGGFDGIGVNKANASLYSLFMERVADNETHVAVGYDGDEEVLVLELLDEHEAKNDDRAYKISDNGSSKTKSLSKSPFEKHGIEEKSKWYVKEQDGSTLYLENES